MSREARSRVTLGVGIPLAALVFLGVLIYAFSRILLAVPESLAPWIALLFATNILVGCAVAATIRGTRGFTFLIGLLVATIVIGGIAGFAIGPREVHSAIADEEHEAGGGGGPAQGETAPPPGEEPAPGGGGQEGGEASIAANGLAFSAGELTVPPGGETVIHLDNQEAQSHNFSVYVAEGGPPIFQGEVVQGPAQVDYTFATPEAGSYYFRCDFHPTTMEGMLTVG